MNELLLAFYKIFGVRCCTHLQYLLAHPASLEFSFRPRDSIKHTREHISQTVELENHPLS